MRSRELLGTALGLALGFTSSLGSAHAETPTETMQGDMHRYFQGEKEEAMIFLGFGIATIGAGTALVTRPTDFSRGLGYPLLITGVLQALGAVIYRESVGAR